MVDKVDMSLADIIKQSKNLRIGARRRRGNTRNFGGGGIRRTARGAMRNGSGGGPLRPRRQANVRSPYRRESGDIDSRWEHDMYDGFTSVRSPRSISGSLVSGSGSGSAKLLISNLEFGVSDSDVTELFAEFGPLKSAAVHYDRSGRSLGTADVIFLRKEDAIKAMKQYNNVPLDGRPMHIQLATSEVPSFDRGLKQGVRQGRIQRPGRAGVFQRGRGGSRRGGGGGGGGNQRNNQGRKMTAEELDAELDAYVNETK